jgi:hypothetical protein
VPHLTTAHHGGRGRSRAPTQFGGDVHNGRPSKQQRHTARACVQRHGRTPCWCCARDAALSARAAGSASCHPHTGRASRPYMTHAPSAPSQHAVDTTCSSTPVHSLPCTHVHTHTDTHTHTRTEPRSNAAGASGAAGTTCRRKWRAGQGCARPPARRVVARPQGRPGPSHAACAPARHDRLAHTHTHDAARSARSLITAALAAAAAVAAPQPARPAASASAS